MRNSNQTTGDVQPNFKRDTEHHEASFLTHSSCILIFLTSFSSFTLGSVSWFHAFLCSRNIPSYLAATPHCLINTIVYHRWQVLWAVLCLVPLLQSLLRTFHQNQGCRIGMASVTQICKPFLACWCLIIKVHPEIPCTLDDIVPDSDTMKAQTSITVNYSHEIQPRLLVNQVNLSLDQCSMDFNQQIIPCWISVGKKPWNQQQFAFIWLVKAALLDSVAKRHR